MKNPSMKTFFREMYNNDKIKSENTVFACVINCTCKLTFVCACACVSDCTHLKEQYANFIRIN